MKALKLTAIFIILIIAIQTSLGADTPQSWQNKSYKYGIFEYKLPPGWILDEKNSNDIHVSFRYIVDNVWIYYVRIRFKTSEIRSRKELESHIAAFIKSANDKKDYVDHTEKPSKHKTLGVKDNWMISYYVSSMKHRAFLLTPVVDSKMYQVYVFDKIENKKALRKEAVDFIANITLADIDNKKITPLQTKVTYRNLVVEGETIPPAKPIPYLDINKITAAQWDGSVAAAMEGMRLVYGPMNQSQEAEFMKAWAPLRQTPFKEAVDYMNKFNPLLGEFLVYRAAVVQSSQLLEEAVLNAGYAAEFDDPEGVRAYMDLASRYRNLLVSREKRLEQIAKALSELGNPPDGRALMAERQGKYKKEKEYLKSLLTTFTPEGCWAGTENQFMESFNLGTILYPEYFYVYKVNTSDGEMYYAIDICVGCNVNSSSGDIIAKVNVRERMRGDFITRELKVPDYTGIGQGGANDGKIFHRWVKFEYPAIPGFSETSDSRFTQLIKQGEEKKITTFNGTFLKQINKNRMADAFFKTAVRWTEEGRWDNYTHDPESMTPNELLIAFSADMGGSAPPATGNKGGTKTKPQTAANPKSNALHIADDKTAEERKKLDAEAIQFHTNNLAIIDKNMVKDRAELAKERDPKRKEALRLRILGAQADQQAEKDRIATIQTGQVVHSRSPWDEYAKAGFIQNIAENQQKLENRSRSIRKAYEMADKLPDDKARAVREVLNSKFSGEMIGSDDEGALRAVVEEANAIGKSYYEGKMAQARADNKEAVAEAEWADACLQTAQVVKTTADYSMMGLSLFGGQYVNNMYQGVTGYIEGGPKDRKSVV